MNSADRYVAHTEAVYALEKVTAEAAKLRADLARVTAERDALLAAAEIGLRWIVIGDGGPGRTDAKTVRDAIENTRAQ